MVIEIILKVIHFNFRAKRCVLTTYVVAVTTFQMMRFVIKVGLCQPKVSVSQQKAI